MNTNPTANPTTVATVTTTFVDDPEVGVTVWPTFAEAWAAAVADVDPDAIVEVEVDEAGGFGVIDAGDYRIAVRVQEVTRPASPVVLG